MKIGVGSDHAGFALKEHVRKYLEAKGHDIVDYGTKDEASSDYPDYAIVVARAVARKEAERGILVCGTGLGISMAANRVRTVRAAPCTSEYEAVMTRRHNDANILALGGRVVTPEIAERIVDAFFSTEFEGGRHQRRVSKIDSCSEAE
jgi:ribose 5-phosphate isomerase B